MKLKLLLCILGLLFILPCQVMANGDDTPLCRSQSLLESILPHVLPTANFSISSIQEKKYDKLIVKVAPADFAHMQGKSGQIIRAIQSLLNEFYIVQTDHIEARPEKLPEDLVGTLGKLLNQQQRVLVISFEKSLNEKLP